MEPYRLDLERLRGDLEALEYHLRNGQDPAASAAYEPPVAAPPRVSAHELLIVLCVFWVAVAGLVAFGLWRVQQ